MLRNNLAPSTLMMKKRKRRSKKKTKKMRKDPILSPSMRIKSFFKKVLLTVKKTIPTATTRKKGTRLHSSSMSLNRLVIFHLSALPSDRWPS